MRVKEDAGMAPRIDVLLLRQIGEGELFVKQETQRLRRREEEDEEESTLGRVLRGGRPKFRARWVGANPEKISLVVSFRGPH